jgi:hypothetical protein
MPDLRHAPTLARLREETPEDLPMTELQAAELRMLADRAGAPVPIHLTARQAQERIAELRGG